MEKQENLFKHELLKIHENSTQFAVSLTRNLDDANDLLQSAFIKAWNARDKFKPKKSTYYKSLKSRYHQIVRNEFINSYRKKKKRNIVGEPQEHIVLSNEYEFYGNSELLLEDFQPMLKKIGEIYAQPLKLRAKGMSYKDIVEYIGVPEGTIKSRISLGRAKMKKLRSES